MSTIVICLWTILYSVVEHQFGLMYYYQAVVSILYAIIYLTISIQFDAQILRLCEKIGFIVSESRALKFELV